MARAPQGLSTLSAASGDEGHSGVMPGAAEILPNVFEAITRWVRMLAWALPGPLESPELTLLTAKAFKIPR